MLSAHCMTLTGHKNPCIATYWDPISMTGKIRHSEVKENTQT
jgi:hypothetical protein